MKTLAVIAESPDYCRIGGLLYQKNDLICVSSGLADKLIDLELASKDPYVIEAAIAAKKAFLLTVKVETSPGTFVNRSDELADRGARVVHYPDADLEVYPMSADPTGSTCA